MTGDERVVGYEQSPVDLLRTIVLVVAAMVVAGFARWARDVVVDLEGDLVRLFDFLTPPAERIVSGIVQIGVGLVVVAYLVVPIVTRHYRLFGYLIVANILAAGLALVVSVGGSIGSDLLHSPTHPRSHRPPRVQDVRSCRRRPLPCSARSSATAPHRVDASEDLPPDDLRRRDEWVALGFEPTTGATEGQARSARSPFGAARTGASEGDLVTQGRRPTRSVRYEDDEGPNPPGGASHPGCPRLHAPGRHAIGC